MNKKVLVADIDPQANLTFYFLLEDKIDEIWNNNTENNTIFQCVKPLTDVADLHKAALQRISDNLYLLAGDVALSGFEDLLSDEWPKSNELVNLYRPLRVLSAFWQILQIAAGEINAEVIMIDIGPNLGAINRSVLIATDLEWKRQSRALFIKPDLWYCLQMLKIAMALALCFNIALLGAKEPPNWFTPLRDAVYGSAGDAAYIARLGGEVEERAKQELSGTELLNMLSYCEFLIAKTYMTEKNNDQAERHFQKGFDYADSSVKDNPTAEGYRMMAENLSQLCTLKSTAWVIANGLKVEQYAKKGLKYDNRNAACSFLIAARWVYAPAPFHNINRGINEMKKILSNSYDPQKEDYFNVYYSIAYAYNRNKKADEAKPWLEKALDIYPENKDALNLGQGNVRIAVPVNSPGSFNAAAE